MTVSDKAFIKAYKQQRRVVKPPLNEAALSAISGNVEAERHPQETSQPTPEPEDNTPDVDVMAVLGKAPSKIPYDLVSMEPPASLAEKPLPEPPAEKKLGMSVSFPAHRITKGKPTLKLRMKGPPAPTVEELDISPVIYRFDQAWKAIPDPKHPATQATPSSQVEQENTEKPATEVKANQAAEPKAVQPASQPAQRIEPAPRNAETFKPAVVEPAETEKNFRVDPAVNQPASVHAAQMPPAAQVPPQAQISPPAPAPIPQATQTVKTSRATQAEAVTPSEYPNSPLPEINYADTQPVSETEPTETGFYQPSTIRVFQPMLQVEHFVWPKVCQRLETAATAELDRLTDVLISKNLEGIKVVAVCGIKRGEGATTLLLSTARGMVSKGVKTVVFDADLHEPQLSSHLGLLPQLGWEDVVTGRQPVEEVLVESIDDNMAVLPLCGPFSFADTPDALPRLLTDSVNALRRYYDLVLLDFGPLESPQSMSELANGEFSRIIDAVILVHNVSKTPAASLLPVQQALMSSGVTIAGVIENFVNTSTTVNR